MQNDGDFEDIILLFRTCFGAGLKAAVKKYLFLCYEQESGHNTPSPVMLWTHISDH